ncbi:hypothetical protein ABKN59_000090 [Abortiporus biennis]
MVTSYGVGVLSNGVADECEDRISASPIMIMIVFNLSVRSGGSDYPGSVHGLQSALRSGHGRLSNMFFVLHLQRLSLSPNLTRTIHVTQGDIDMLVKEGNKRSFIHCSLLGIVRLLPSVVEVWRAGGFKLFYVIYCVCVFSTSQSVDQKVNCDTTRASSLFLIFSRGHWSYRLPNIAQENKKLQLGWIIDGGFEKDESDLLFPLLSVPSLVISTPLDLSKGVVVTLKL